MFKKCLLATLALSGFAIAQTSVPERSNAPVILAAANIADSRTAVADSNPGPSLAIAVAVVNRSTCASGEASAKECKVRWGSVLKQSFVFAAIQNGGNLALGPDFRYAISHGRFWSNYVDAVTAPHRFTHWSDGDEAMVNYVGHPMMGAVVDNIYLQNDPKVAGLEFGKNKEYWTSHGRAMLYTAAYTAQWKIGPFGEATIGNVGRGYYAGANGKLTNGAGLVDFVVTPVVGTAWSVGEDSMDRFVVKKWRSKTKNPLLLTSLSMLTPNKSVANVLRFKAPWYRD